MLPIPTNPDHLSTWSWYVVVAAAFLHALEVLPSAAAHGALVLGTSVFVGGFLLQYKRPRETGRTRLQTLFETGNVGQHALPLLLIVVACLLKPPGAANYVMTLLAAATVPLLYLLRTHLARKTVQDNYKLPTARVTRHVMIAYALLVAVLCALL